MTRVARKKRTPQASLDRAAAMETATEIAGTPAPEPPAPITYDCAGPVLGQFFASDHRRRVLLGSFGSGKSTACCVEIIRRAKDQKPNRRGERRTRWAIIRNTYPDLKNTTVKTWKDWWGEQFGTFNNVAPFVHNIRFAMADNTRVECEVIFLALDDEADAKKFLSLELTGIYFNELRELPYSVVEAGDGRLGRYPSMRDGGPTWHGMIADTNMPDEDHWIYDLAEKQRSPGWSFFLQPGGVIKVDGDWVQNPHAENLKNLVPGYYTDQLVGKSDAWIAVHLGSQWRRLPREGAYFTDDLQFVESKGRVLDLNTSPELPVHTFWDIGMHDYMAIWFGQAVGDDWNFLAYYENNGKALDHYAGIMNDLKAANRWTWGDHVWPHDGAHKDVGILGAKTRAEVFSSLGFRAPIIMPRRQNPGDWIDATRLFLRKCRFDRMACAIGLNHLRGYTKRKDAVRNVFLDEPLHNEHSHGADAFQIAALGRGRVSNKSATWNQKIIDFKFEYAG